MSILDINGEVEKKQIKKTIIVYFILSVFAVVINKVYGVFGHGVESSAMTWMFLYPLLGGVLLYFLISLFCSNIVLFKCYRIFYNIYNSGIATLTVGSFLKGILEIAGTNSGYLVFFYTAGCAFIVIGLIMMGIMAVKEKMVHE